jgi:hypothetical protein
VLLLLCADHSIRIWHLWCRVDSSCVWDMYRDVMVVQHLIGQVSIGLPERRTQPQFQLKRSLTTVSRAHNRPTITALGTFAQQPRHRGEKMVVSMSSDLQTHTQADKTMTMRLLSPRVVCPADGGWAPLRCRVRYGRLVANSSEAISKRNLSGPR